MIPRLRWDEAVLEVYLDTNGVKSRVMVYLVSIT
jgi:hypothetical protein